MSDMLAGFPVIDLDPELERALAEHDADIRGGGCADEWPVVVAETDVRSVPPSAHLVDVLESRPIAASSDAELLDAIVGWERVAAYAAARQQRLIAAFAARRPDRSTDLDRELLGRDAEPLRGAPGVPEVDRTAADELALALTISSQSAERRLLLAMELTHRLPQTLRSLASGKLTLAHARMIADETHELSAAQAIEAERIAIDRLDGKTPAQWRRAVKRIVLRVDSDAVRKRRERTRAHRKVELIPYPDGAAELRAELAAADAVAVFSRLDQCARKAKALGDKRSLDQLRADALVHLVLHGAGPAGQPLINVTMPAAVAAGLSDQPAELDGYGPIDADYARALAGSGMWRRITTDPDTGAVIGMSKKYRPPQALRDLVAARHPQCVFPTCSTPATRCDFDHLHAHAAGGDTTADNLVPECKRHHRTKHHRSWRVRRRSDGAVEWTTPTTRTYAQS